MANRRYDPSDPKDAKLLLQMLESLENEDQPEFEDESDTDCEDNVEERNEDSETVQEASSGSSSGNEEDTDYFVGKDKLTKWKKTKYSQRVKHRPQNILVRLPGVVGSARQAKTILECWKCFIGDDMLDKIVRHTNEYIELISSRYSRERDVKCTDLVEMKAFIGLLYLAGVLRSNRLSLEELWGEDGYGVEMFRLVMSIKRFKFLLRCIRFDNKGTRQERRQIDKLAAIRDLFTMFVENCKSSYSPGQNVTIDEMLPGFRGRCAFKQYIPSKPNKYGIKLFALVDSKVLYIYNLEVYLGTQPEGPFQISNKPPDVVKRLTTPIYNTGRNITADNWFTDLQLVNFLQTQKISYVGTVKKNKRQLPPEFVSTKTRAEKTSVFGFQQQATIVSYVPKKGKNVVLLSSMHFDESIDEDTGHARKPNIITFYNQTKSGVDLVDKMCATYNVQRNTRRWPLVIFFTMLNVSGINTQVIYSGNGNNVDKRRKFLKQLSSELVVEQLERRAAKGKGIPTNLKNKLKKFIPDANLQADETEPNNSATNNKRKRCASCVQNDLKRYTKYFCKGCNTFLCLGHAIMVCNNCFLSKFNGDEADGEDSE